MKKFIIRALFVTIMFSPFNAFGILEAGETCQVNAINCAPGTDQTMGCCAENLYCDPNNNADDYTTNVDGTCKPCFGVYTQSDQSNDTHAGLANSVGNCYTKCKNYIDTYEHIQYTTNKTDKVYYGESVQDKCKYTQNCYPATGCDGYMWNSSKTQCIPRFQSYSDGTVTYEGTTYETKNACNAESDVFITIEQVCDTNTGICIKKTGSCHDDFMKDTLYKLMNTLNFDLDDINNKLGDPGITAGARCATSYVTGESPSYTYGPTGRKLGEIISFSPDDEQYTYNEELGYFDLSNCTCNYMQTSYDIKGCKASVKCHWKNTSINNDYPDYFWHQNCVATHISDCDAGYCFWGTNQSQPYDENGTALFGQTPQGYYHMKYDSTNTTCQPCPAGMTSPDAPNTDAKACFISGGKTEFCDGATCLTLPPQAGDIKYP